MSPQSLQVTRSPNHWWPSSWEIRSSSVGEHFGGDFRVIERAAGVCGGAGILHSAGDKVIDHDLRVFFPGVLDAELLAEQIDHCRGTAVVDRTTITAALRPVIGYRQTAPG